MNQEKNVVNVFVSSVSAAGEFVHAGQFMVVLDNPESVAQLSAQELPPAFSEMLKERLFFHHPGKKPLLAAKEGKLQVSILQAACGFAVHACCAQIYPECKVITHKYLVENKKSGRKFGVSFPSHYFELNKGAEMHAGGRQLSLSLLNSYLEHASDAELKLNDEKNYLLFYYHEDSPTETSYAHGFQTPFAEASEEEKAAFAKCPKTHYPMIIRVLSLNVSHILQIPRAKWHAREKFTLEDIVRS